MLLCVGTTSYLKPGVLRDWCRVVKPNGLLIFTHKTAVWPSWEPLQARLVEDAWWNETEIWTDLNYLPGYDDNARINERAKIYCYSKAERSLLSDRMIGSAIVPGTYGTHRPPGPRALA